MKRFTSRHSFARIALASAFGLLVSAPAFAANPALWRARDADTTVYFFGTVHVVPKDMKWHYPALDKALAASKVLYIEVADADQATLRPLVLKYGLDPTHPLSTKISKDENALLQQAGQELGTAMGRPQLANALEMMKPWLAGLTIAMAPILKAGFDPKLGVDKQLQAQFTKDGKPVKGLETAKEQILFIANLPEKVQLAMLRQTLHDYKHAKQQLDAIIAAWKAGDVKKIADTVDLKMKSDAPTLYKTLLVNRNATWAKQISALMASTPGTIFIAVGTGHLVGPDRLQLKLKKYGITVTRVGG